MKASDGLCFVFICQAGALEAKAMLLAASLRRYLTQEHELVAAVPQPEERWGPLSAETVATLKRLSVRIVPVVNRVSLQYPIGNKIDCLAVTTDRAKIVFLDSDMLFLRIASFAALQDVRIGAVPASFAPVDDPDWPLYYRSCGLPPPTTNGHKLISGAPSPPYFNAGFVMADRDYAARLADEWSDCARLLLQVEGLPAAIRDRYLDQVSLPIAAARLSLPIAPLAEEWNFPSWYMHIGERPVPAFFHYQHISRLMREKVTEDILFELIDANPGVGQAILSMVRAAEADQIPAMGA